MKKILLALLVSITLTSCEEFDYKEDDKIDYSNDTSDSTPWWATNT